MSEVRFTPSQQVERIRGILQERESKPIEPSVRNLEIALPESWSDEVPFQQRDHFDMLHQTIARETQALKKKLQVESNARQQQISQLIQSLGQSTTEGFSSPNNQASLEKVVHHRLEQTTAELSAYIDTRMREMLHHLQSELLQWKSEMNRELSSIREVKADRSDIKNRFSRIAAAAMEDNSPIDVPEGYLL